jgi:phosphate transporter
LEKPLVSSLVEKPKPIEVKTPLGRVQLPTWLGGKAWILVLASLIFVAICESDWFDSVEKRNCAGMLVFCTILWATEVINLSLSLSI